MTEEVSAQEPLAAVRMFRMPDKQQKQLMELAKARNVYVPIIEEEALKTALGQFHEVDTGKRAQLASEFTEGIKKQYDEIAMKKPKMIGLGIQLRMSDDTTLARVSRELGVLPEHFVPYAINKYVNSEREAIENWKKDEERKDNTINLLAGGVQYKEERTTYTSLPHDHLVVGLTDPEALDTSAFDEDARKLIEVANEALDEMSREHPEVLNFRKSDTLKYIVLRQQQDGATQDAMLVFPYARMHDDLLRDMRRDGVRGAVVSAGFIKLTQGENGTTRRIFGYSESLKENNVISIHDSTTYRTTMLQPKLADKGFTFE